MKIDLHIHTNQSDGTYSPEDIVKEAIALNLRCIAITDHDTTSGILSAQSVAKKYASNLKIINGIELSTELNGKSVHILGYHIDIDNKELQEKISELRKLRVLRFEKILAKVNSCGYYLTLDECNAYNETLGRPHIAQALVKKGYFSNVNEAFKQLLAKGKPCYVSQPKLTPTEAINLIHNANGIAILAHPGEINDLTFVKYLIDNYKFDGIELFHPNNKKEDLIFLKNIAQEKNLFLSGGSDFHGIKGRYPERLGVFNFNDKDIIPLIDQKKV